MPRFDYLVQAWVDDTGHVLRCGHTAPQYTCYACNHHGEKVYHAGD